MEMHEYWKLSTCAIPLQLVIASIETAGRYFALIILSVISKELPWKPSKPGFAFDKFRSNLPGSPRMDLYVNVLLHELYPAKEASAAEPIDRDGRLSPQDFIQALQKIDLQGGMPENLADASFIFHPTSHASACSTSWTPTLPCKPGPSTDDNLELLPISRSTSSPAFDPMFSPITADPTWSDTEKVDGLQQDITTLTDISELPEVVGPQSDLAISPESDRAFKLESVPPEPCSSDISIKTDGENTDRERSVEPASSNDASGNHSVWTQDSSITICNFENNPIPSSSIPRVYRLHSELLFGTGKTTATKVDEDDVNAQNTQLAVVPPVPSSCVSSPLTANLSRSSRRKSVLKPINVGQRRSRSTSFSSASDLEPLSGSSLDSGLDYRPFVLKPDPDHAPGVGNGSDARLDTLSRSCCSLSTTSSLVFPTGTGSRFEHEGSTTRSPRQASGSTSSDFPTSQRSVGRRADYQRDIIALEQANVPFSYEEIIYASNEQFKEMKSSPYLTPHQLDVMLEARKRSSNRQAAERCRRLKLATRDDLSEQLAALRLERQLLVRQVAQARQRKQIATNALMAEQQRVLSLLRGPEGDELKCSDWRIRLTHDDEVVVVAVGQ